MRGAIALTAAGLGLALGGCGSDGDSGTPAACLGGPDTYLDALRVAPEEVRLGGETPISDCLTEAQPGGALASVGRTVVEAGTQLNSEALEDPSGDATVQLGYLVGAVQQGASTTGGIHTDLVRRLDAAARFNPDGGSPGAAFERGFGEGYAAGQARG